MKKILLLVLTLMIILGLSVSAGYAHNYQKTRTDYSPHNPWFTVWYNSNSTNYWDNTQTKVGYATVNATYDPAWRADISIYSYVNSAFTYKGGTSSPWQYYSDSAASDPYSWTSGAISILSRKQHTRVYGTHKAKQCAPGYGCGYTFVQGWSQYPTSGADNHYSLAVDALIWTE